MPEGAKKLKKKADSRARTLPPFDLPLAIIVLTLVVFGLVMLFSASYAYAFYRRKGDSYSYIRPQFILAMLGIILMYVISLFDYHILHKFAWPIMGFTLVLLIVVLFMPELNGAKRWIIIPGVPTFQPSEIAKFAVILVFAHMIAVNADKMKTFLYGVAPFGVVLGLIAILMILEPHLSGLILISGIGVIMMFIGGTGLVWFGLALAIGIAGVAGAVIMMPDLVPYAMERVYTWRHPFEDVLDAGHQTVQSLYAIGSGGLFGRGIGNSVQKHLYVPEPQNDFIFSILCEELGFIGALLVIFLFVALLWRGLYIAYKAKDKFGSMLVVGVIAQVTLQAVLNIAVVTNTIPNTGISLPFFSAGGTSLLMLLGEMGVVLSVSRQSSINKV